MRMFRTAMNRALKEKVRRAQNQQKVQPPKDSKYAINGKKIVRKRRREK
jgi:hypothetical protein